MSFIPYVYYFLDPALPRNEYPSPEVVLTARVRSDRVRTPNIEIGYPFTCDPRGVNVNIGGSSTSFLNEYSADSRGQLRSSAGILTQQTFSLSFSVYYACMTTMHVDERRTCSTRGLETGTFRQDGR